MFSAISSCSCLCSKHSGKIQVAAFIADAGIGCALLLIGVVGAGYLAMSPAAGYALLGVGGGSIVVALIISGSVLCVRGILHYAETQKMDAQLAALKTQ